jgi:hypothetical protein
MRKHHAAARFSHNSVNDDAPGSAEYWARCSSHAGATCIGASPAHRTGAGAASRPDSASRSAVEIGRSTMNR